MKKKEDGLLSLEASISLTLFIFLMLFMYSYFVVFEARNVMAHATLTTADSLALDVYQTDTVAGSDDLGTLMYDIYHGVYNIAGIEESPFHSSDKWYELDGTSTTWNGNIYVSSEGTANDENFSDRYGNSAYVSSELGEVIKERFFAYLAGSDSDEYINEVLEKYHIVGGQDGVSFSGSRIVDGDLYVVVTYALDYEFDVFDLFNITFEQSACSKIWK